LKVATRMDTYGIEPFDAKDQRGNGIAVGFNFKGLSVFKSSQQVNFFRWESMLTYECEKKTVVITIKTRDVSGVHVSPTQTAIVHIKILASTPAWLAGWLLQ
uniref:FERM domain-containing protein n=1 Tax=Hydatigena taeniaeformis TaxID=6205 RepID=A0A0R3WSI7_HYDTA